MSAAQQRFRILHVILAIKPTNCQYNEHCLPLMHERDISICTYFKSNIQPPDEITLFDGDGSVRGFFRTLRRALTEKEYDVIHVHTPHAGLLFLLTILMMFQYRKFIRQGVHTVHNSYQNFKLRNKLMFLPSFWLFRSIVFCSYSSFESFPGFYKWLAGNRMHVVQNGVDLDRIDRAIQAARMDHAGIDAQHFTVTAVGMIPIKNPTTLFQAFCQAGVANGRLVVMGDGNLRPVLQQEAERQGLQERVNLTGMIPRDQVFKNFLQSDVYVSASHGEGLPVAVLEAMACARPVVLSDIPPHREIAQGFDFIPLVAMDDAAGFAREIQRFSEMSASQRVEIGKRCRKIVEDRFSLPAMHANYRDVYQDLMAAGVSPVLNKGIEK